MPSWPCSPPTAPTAPSATPTPSPTSPRSSPPHRKGLFMVGTPALELDGDAGTGEQPLCFVDQTEPRHAHRLVHRHLPPHHRRLATADPGDDVPPQERRPRLGPGARPHPPRARRQLTSARPMGVEGIELAEFRVALDTLARRAPRRAGPRSPRPRHARRSDGPPVEGEAAHLRRRLDALGLARTGRRPGRIDAAARLPRRGARRARPGRARHLLDDRGPGPDDDRLRHPGARRRDGASPAAGRRDLVPGVLRARAPAATSPRCRAGPNGADDGWRVTGQKVWTSLAQYAERCVLLTRTGTPESAHRGITALFVDMDSPGITVRPIETMHGAPEFSEVFFDDVAVPLERTLGDEGQGWSVAMDLLPFERSTALWAPRRLPAPPTPAAARHGPTGRTRRRRGSAR